MVVLLLELFEQSVRFQLLLDALLVRVLDLLVQTVDLAILALDRLGLLPVLVHRLQVLFTETGVLLQQQSADHLQVLLLLVHQFLLLLPPLVLLTLS